MREEWIACVNEIKRQEKIYNDAMTEVNNIKESIDNLNREIADAEQNLKNKQAALDAAEDAVVAAQKALSKAEENLNAMQKDLTSANTTVQMGLSVVAAGEVEVAEKREDYEIQEQEMQRLLNLRNRAVQRADAIELGEGLHKLSELIIIVENNERTPLHTVPCAATSCAFCQREAS